MPLYVQLSSKGLSRLYSRMPTLSSPKHAARIGDTKVSMSNFEQDKYINYQRIEDNLQVVRKRLVALLLILLLCIGIVLTIPLEPHHHIVL